MPSINRLVLLAVLSLSIYVQSAPAPNAVGAKLVRAIVVTERDVVAARESEFDDHVEELVERVVDEEQDIELDLSDPNIHKKPVAVRILSRILYFLLVMVRKAPINSVPVKTPEVPAKSCPIKKPATTRTLASRAYEYIAHLFARDDQEFIGWHGTNSDTAAFWAQKGQLERPVKPDGFFDFIGLGPKSTSGTSGADAEIGPGVYVTDDRGTATFFANGNAKVNKGTTAQVCAIFAKSSLNWRTAIRKAFIPRDLVRDASDPTKKAQYEDARLAYIQRAIPGVSATNVVKFSLLDREIQTGQLVLPASITHHFTAKCFRADGGASAPGTSTFPAFTYNGNVLRREWNIAAEIAGQHLVANASAAADCA
ncbi:hypothetical protein B0H19DRAFT_564102 [Mycena capillaripes]|nr:hypothetical protein B0H19DRAFT_564102 [Mycena capillaripes]